jgi:O-antigen ligase
MDPRLRTLLFGLGASALAVWVGFSLANENLLVAGVAAGAALWIILSWVRGPLAEAWLLGFLFFGYIVGNRGFAQVSPVPGFPLFSGELGLAVVLVLVALRGALERTLPVRRDRFNGLLLLWIALGTGRIFWDVRTFGMLALRDFAMVYYALYFFAAQAIAAHGPSRKLLRGALLLTFGLLPLTGLLSDLFPDFFLTHFLVGGVPLIFYKGDLLATFLFTGFLVLLPTDEVPGRSGWWRWLPALGSLALGLNLLSRSSMLGLAVALSWLAWSGCWRPVRVLAAVVALGVVALTLVSLLQDRDFTKTKAYAIYETVVSVTDYSGTRDYQNDLSSDKGDNNRFRLVWWRNVAEETLAKSPVLGQGFGADLAHGFLEEYYPIGDFDFSARSPHNIFLTTLGRMGLVGAAVLLALYFAQGRMTARLARLARTDPTRRDAMTLQAAVWVVMVSSCLGVVIEGPMGAIPFWIMLGLAHEMAGSPET